MTDALLPVVETPIDAAVTAEATSGVVSSSAALALP